MRLIAILCCACVFASCPRAAHVAHHARRVNGFGCHVVQVNLGRPDVKVTPVVSLRFPGGAEPMSEMCAREQPVAAVTGTFFCKTTLMPVGDIVIDGRLLHRGARGSAIAITSDNRVVFERLPFGLSQDWSPFESVLACGPTLLERGKVALAPRHEHFGDPHVLGTASRTAVGLTPRNKLLMVATREQMSLWDLAKVMRALGCIAAINLDGGASTGMYYRGSAVVKPGRPLVNMLAVYEDVARESRICRAQLPASSGAIYRYRASQAYDIYMEAQMPLASGRLERAVRLLRRATQLDPYNASYEVRLAETLLRLDDTRAASMAWARAGEILLQKQQWREALARFRLALERYPENLIAHRGLPQAYRGLGMELLAQAAEYHLRLWELESSIVATHPELMHELLTCSAGSGAVTQQGLRAPTLAAPAAADSYVDAALRLELDLPANWEFAPRPDPSSLLMRHRYQPLLAHLRVSSLPAQVALDRLVDLYWERSFARGIYRTPVVADARSDGVRVTETVSSIDSTYCETVFALRGDLLHVLSMAASESDRAAAVADFARIAESLRFF